MLLVANYITTAVSEVFLQPTFKVTHCMVYSKRCINAYVLLNLNESSAVLPLFKGNCAKRLT